MSDIKETTAIKTWKFDKEKSLKHWIFFEFICTLASLYYIFDVVQNLNVAFEGAIMVATVLILLRSTLLFRLWYSID